MHIAARLMPALGLYFTSAAPAPVLGQPALPEADPRVPVSDIVPQRSQAQSQAPSQPQSQPQSQPHSQALSAGQTDTIDQARSAEGAASDWIEASIPAAPAWQAETNFDVASRRRIEAEAQAHPLDVAPEPDPGDATPRVAISLRATSPELAIVPESHRESAKRIQEEITHFSRQTIKKMEDELASQIDLIKRDPTQPSLAKLTELAWKMAAAFSASMFMMMACSHMDFRRSMPKWSAASKSSMEFYIN
jgi:hypothetical protein